MFYDKNHNMTREGMEYVINAGGSVAYGGRIISTIASLPAKEDLAKTQDEKSAVASELDRQIEALKARRDAIATPAAPQSPPAPDTYGDDKHPLDYFIGMTDEQIDDVKGIGPSTVKVIRDALTKLGK